MTQTILLGWKLTQHTDDFTDMIVELSLDVPVHLWGVYILIYLLDLQGNWSPPTPNYPSTTHHHSPAVMETDTALRWYCCHNCWAVSWCSSPPLRGIHLDRPPRPPGQLTPPQHPTIPPQHTITHLLWWKLTQHWGDIAAIIVELSLDVPLHLWGYTPWYTTHDLLHF